MSLENPEVKAEKVAEYTGTSLEMIQRHYLKRGVRPEVLEKLGGPSLSPIRRLAVVA